MRLLIFCMALALSGTSALAQESGLSFLRIGTNAAALAMGDAGVAHSQDAFATYWNPAGLAAGQQNTVALSHHRWIGDMRTYVLASRYRAGQKGGLGLFITGTTSGDLDARERPGEPQGTFDARFINAGLAYGRTLGPLRAGVAFKYLNERIFDNNATGYGFDAGVQLDLFAKSLHVGAALQNLGKMSDLGDVATKLPRTLRIGTAFFPFRILMQDDGTAMLNTFLTAEVSHLLTDEVTRFHIGAAAEILDMIRLRAGYVTNDALRSVSFGGGLHFNSLVFDYALVPFESGFDGPAHIVTLTYGW